MPLTEVERQLLEHKYQIESLEEGLERKDANIEDIRRDVRALKKTVQEDHDNFTTYVAVAKSAAEAAEKAANSSVSAKQLYISFASATCVILGIILPFIAK